MALDFHFINVGKGNCTLINFPNGHLSIIDIDDSRSISTIEQMVMQLSKKALPVNPLDYIAANFPNESIFRFILTHPDMDHMSGIKALFDKKSVYNFWDIPNNKPDPGNWDTSPYDKEDWDFYQDLRNSKKNITVVTPLRDQISECCWIQDGIYILSPDKELLKKAEDCGEYDHLSYVLMIDYAGKKILLGSDSTKFAWENILEFYGNSLETDIFLAPGHGSKNHISSEILDVIKPRLVIVSVAVNIDYDYELYKRYGRVLSTKHYGNIKVKIDDNGEILFTTQFQNYSDNWYILNERDAYYL